MVAFGMGQDWERREVITWDEGRKGACEMGLGADGSDEEEGDGGRLDERRSAAERVSGRDGVDVEAGLEALEPDTGLFWQNNSSGVNTWADFWDVVGLI